MILPDKAFICYIEPLIRLTKASNWPVVSIIWFFGSLIRLFASSNFFLNDFAGISSHSNGFWNEISGLPNHSFRITWGMILPYKAFICYIEPFIKLVKPSNRLEVSIIWLLGHWSDFLRHQNFFLNDFAGTSSHSNGFWNEIQSLLKRSFSKTRV